MDSLYGEEGEHSPSMHEGKSVDDETREESADTDIIKTKVLQSGEDDKVEVGDERVVKVLEVYGDTCKVMYAPKEEKEKPSGEGEPMTDDQELDQMSEKGPKY